jgi:TolB-like protein/DNA-binding winged helix-turn-helix (wHTH) protein
LDPTESHDVLTDKVQAFSDCYRFESFEIDCVRRELRRNGIKIHLAGRPFTLLMVLVESQGRLVTREELRGHLWSSDTYVDFDTNLTTVFYKVRQALGDSSKESRFLQTIPGQGYRFIEPVLPLKSEIAALPQLDIAPGGKTTFGAPSSVLANSNSSSPSGRRYLIALYLMAAVLVAGTYLGYRGIFSASASRSQPVRLLVLPFIDTPGDAEGAYFADGLNDELITKLTRLRFPQLSVIARTTAMRYKNTNKTIQEVGHELKVNYVVEGAVQRANGRIHISVRLVSTANQSPIWAESYDRPFGDVLNIESDVASRIGEALSIRVAPRTQFSDQRPLKTAAYEEYLKGRYFWNKRDPRSLRKALDSYQSCTAKDPNFAPAYAGLAETYVAMAALLPSRPDETYAKAREAAQKALLFDDTLPGAHAALAAVAWENDHDWERAEQEFQHTIELDPGYATGLQWHAEFLSAMGRSGEALKEIKRARELDPLSLIVNTMLGYIYYIDRDYDHATEAFQRTLELDPNFFWAHEFLWLTDLQTGKFDAAVNEYAAAVSWIGAPPEPVEELRRRFASGGIQAARSWILESQLNGPRSARLSDYQMALLYVGLGRKGEAIRCLSAAYDNRVHSITQIGVEPALDPLRSEPEFQRLMQKMHYPVPRQNSIRAENGAILSRHGANRALVLDRELFFMRTKVLLDRILGTDAVCVYKRMDEESVPLSSSIVTVMQPAETLVRKDGTRGY